MHEPKTHRVAAPRSLEELGALDARPLGRLYREATAPRLADLHGDLAGRMLASPLALGPAAAALRIIAGSAVFPWRGKSFRHRGGDRGEGVNRVFLDRWRLFPFETRVGRSRAGDFDAIHLDYSSPRNPFFIRMVADEIREVAPGLYLGQMYATVLGKARLFLYFGLARPSKPGT